MFHENLLKDLLTNFYLFWIIRRGVIVNYILKFLKAFDSWQATEIIRSIIKMNAKFLT